MELDIIPSKQFDSYIEENAYIIVDVREEEEYEKGHIRGAINIPFDEDTRNVDRYQKGKQYILYCEHGKRSLIAAGILCKGGIEAKTVNGGILAYHGANFVDTGDGLH